MNSNTDTTTHTFVPPYNLTWQTFVNSLDRMAEDHALPSVIDRSYLNWMPGSVQTSYLALARQSGLVDADDAPTALLRELVYQADDRPKLVERLVREHYAPILELELNSTAQQLLDLWKATFNQSGETRRKAVRFFMAAAKFAEVPVGQNWERDVSKISRSGPAPRRSRARTAQIPKQASPSEPSARSTVTVTLDNEAGSLSLSVEDIDLLKLTESDRKFVFGIVDSMRKYQSSHRNNEPDDVTDESDETTD